MRLILSILVLFVAMPLMAADSFDPADTVFSQSGQFVVYGRKLGASPSTPLRFDRNFNRVMPQRVPFTPVTRVERFYSATNTGMVLLDPNYLAVSAERVKGILNRQLDRSDQWRGKVYLTLQPSASLPEEIPVFAALDRTKHRWNYQASIPQEVESDRLLELLVKIFVAERAHRKAGSQVEVPVWLLEGLTGYMEAIAGPRVFFRQDQPLTITRQPSDQVKELSRALERVGVYSLEELSWPTAEMREEEGSPAKYRVNAHAFVAELLRLPEGGRKLAAFIDSLPAFANWQFAFLNAFQSDFDTLLDTEKWWTITSLQLSNQAMPERWGLAESLNRLENLLTFPVRFRQGDEGDFFTEDFPFPRFLTEMSFQYQEPALARLAARLHSMEFRSAPEAFALVHGHRQMVESYLHDMRQAVGSPSDKRSVHKSPFIAVEDALQRLEQLNQSRIQLRESMVAESASRTAPAAPANN